MGLAVGGFLVVVVVLGAVLLLTGGSSSIAEEEVAASLDDILDEADFDTSADLRDCPLGDIDAIADAAGEVLDEELDLPDDTQNAFDEFEDDEAGVVCIAADDEDDPSEGIFAFSTPVPSGDYADAIESTFEDDDVTVEEPDGFRGGEIYAYCVEPGEDSTNEGCGADWLGEDITVGLFLQDLGADPETAAEILRDQVADMADALEVAEPDFTE
ncbi:hypothetical protein BH24ACT4_BH24ACT4_20420 [soil metagenome]